MEGNKAYSDLLLTATSAMKDVADATGLSVREVVAVARLLEIQEERISQVEPAQEPYGYMTSPNYTYSVG